MAGTRPRSTLHGAVDGCTGNDGEDQRNSPIPLILYDTQLMNSGARRRAIIVDLDGTLAIIGARSPYDAAQCRLDTINQVVRDIALSWRQTNRPHGEILVVSGRQELHRPQTELWLENHKFPYSHLWMRQTGDNRKDALVKREIFEDNIQNVYRVVFVLDDRTQVVNMWRRELHLICLQVAEGDF